MYIGVDIGGTFTDLVVLDDVKFYTAKVPTNSENPADSIFKALEKITFLKPPSKFLHSTTLVTNMILEHKGVKTAFITSEGMKDVLHIARHARPLNYAVKQEIAYQHYPPCPDELRFTVPERIDVNGDDVISFKEEYLYPVAEELKKEKIEALGIGFLHSYLYPENELKAYDFLSRMLPDVFISLSNEVSPRFREFERFITTAWNAGIAPPAVNYLTDLLHKVKAKWEKLQVSFMTSNGGLEEINTDVAIRGDLKKTPIRLGLSGPAAAGNAVRRISQDLKLDYCVGLDIGGTSSDIVIVQEGRLKEAAWEDRKIGGYTFQIPMLDLHTIGAGGGSLLYKDRYGVMHVGPESAGAYPGPACYGLGGEKPALTDAAVICGRLPEDVLLGGEIPINAKLSYEVFAKDFASKDREEIDRTASEALALAESNIACAIREKTVARGIDPKELTLVAAGGAGPLLACGIADILDIGNIIIPPGPGLLSAWGLLAAPEKHESVVTILKLLDEITEQEILSFLKKAKDNLSKQPPLNADVFYTAALKYLGQGFELEIKLDEITDTNQIRLLFNKAHEKEYGFSFDNVPVEWVDLRIVWEESPVNWEFKDFQKKMSGKTEKGTVNVRELDKATAQIAQYAAGQYVRDDLQTGDLIKGPAIILEEDTTSYIASGWDGIVLAGGYIKLHLKRVKKED